MLVKELIEKLSQLNQNLPVIVNDIRSTIAKPRQMKVGDIDIVSAKYIDYNSRPWCAVLRVYDKRPEEGFQAVYLTNEDRGGGWDWGWWETPMDRLSPETQNKIKRESDRVGREVRKDRELWERNRKSAIRYSERINAGCSEYQNEVNK